MQGCAHRPAALYARDEAGQQSVADIVCALVFSLFCSVWQPVRRGGAAHSRAGLFCGAAHAAASVRPAQQADNTCSAGAGRSGSGNDSTKSSCGCTRACCPAGSSAGNHDEWRQHCRRGAGPIQLLSAGAATPCQPGRCHCCRGRLGLALRAAAAAPGTAGGAIRGGSTAARGSNSRGRHTQGAPSAAQRQRCKGSALCPAGCRA